MSPFERVGVRVRRVIALLLAAIGVSSLAVAVVLVLVGPPDVGDPADTVGLVLQALGLVTVLGALAFSARWRGTVTVNALAARRLLTGSIVVAAVAESGFLLSVIGYVIRPELMLGVGGAVAYIATLLVLLAATRSALIEGE